MYVAEYHNMQLHQRDTDMKKIMNNRILISVLGLICVFIGVFFSSILIVGLLPFLLLLVGVLKIYELNEDKH